MAVESRFDTREETVAYLDWTTAPLRKMIEAEQQYCPTRDEFLERLRNTNYLDAKEIFSLEDFCSGSHYPILLLGHHKGIQYKLLPGNRLKEPEINWQDDPPMMSNNILGINLHIEPKCVAAGRDGRRAHGSDSHEFRILHQIEGVMYYTGDFSKVKGTPEANDRKKWRDTHFALVSDVTSGKAGAVYLIYDFFPFIPNLGECKHIDNDYEWGFLPKDEEDEDQFSCAKIANSLDDMNVAYEFKFEERFDYEIEIVPAVQTQDGTLDRQTVEEPLSEDPNDESSLTEDTFPSHARTLSNESNDTAPSEMGDPVDGVNAIDTRISVCAEGMTSLHVRTPSEESNTPGPSRPGD